MDIRDIFRGTKALGKMYVNRQIENRKEALKAVGRGLSNALTKGPAEAFYQANPKYTRNVKIATAARFPEELAKTMYSGTGNFVKEAGKTFGTGLAYWNPGGVYGKYDKRYVPMNDLPTPTQMLGKTARAGLELYVPKGLGWLSKMKNPALGRILAGVLPGYGYDVANRVAEGASLKRGGTYMPGYGTALGGTFGYGMRPAVREAGAEVANIKNDFRKLTDPRTIVPKADRYVPAGTSAVIEGRPQMILDQNAFVPQSATFKLLDKLGDNPAGMSIKATAKNPLIQEARKTGVVEGWETRNQYIDKNPYKNQIDAMRKSKKFDSAILQKASRWEMEQVLKDKPSYLSDGVLSTTEIQRFAKKNGLAIGFDSKNTPIIAKSKEALNKVLGAKTQRELGLALGYEDITPKSQPLQEGGVKLPRSSKVPGQAPAQSQAPTQQGSIPLLKSDTGASKVSTYYNINRLKVGTKAKKAIQSEISNAGKQLEQTVGKTLTNKEILDIAESTGQILDTTIGREKTSQKIAANLNLRRKIAQVAKDGKIDGEFLELWIKDKAAGEDIARQLQARRIVADPEEARAINAVLDAVYKQSKNADEVIKAAKNVDFNDQEQVTKFYRQFVKPNVSDWLDVIRYNSMLSSPNTHIVNAFSNLEGSAIITPIEKTLSGMFDAIRAGVTGGKRKQFAGEGIEYAKGYVSSVGKASQNFLDVITGKRSSLNPDVRNIPLTQKGTAARGLEKTLRVATDFLEAMDQFFTALTKGGVEKSLQYRATKLGKPIKDAESIAAQEAAQRLFRATKNPDQGHILSMFDGLTNGLMRLRNSDNVYLKTLSRFTFPFVRTPINILKQGIEYSPMGVLTLHGAANKTEQLSKIAIGTASATAAAMLLGEDRLTWAEPTNAKRKAEFRASGRQPYSIKIGDNWISYSKLHPAVAFNLAFVSAIDDSIKNGKLNEDEADKLLNSFAKYGKFLADQSYAKNMGDALAAVQGDTERFTSYFANYGQQLIPFKSLMGWITRMIDPVQRKIDTDGTLLEKQMQQVMMNIPGLSDNVPARTDQFGGEIPNQNRFLNAISPNRVTTERPIYEKFYQQSLQTSRENSAKNEIKKQFEKGKLPASPDKKMQAEISRLQKLKDKEDVKDELSSGGDASVYEKYPEGTITKSMVNELYENNDIGETVKAQLDRKIAKYEKVKDAKYVKTILDQEGPSNLYADGILTPTKVDALYETGQISGKQAYVLQKYIVLKDIEMGKIQRKKAKAWKTFNQKYAYKYRMNTQQKPKQIKRYHPYNLKPYYGN